MRNRIGEGDVVNIDFATSQSFHKVTVVGIPCATGDSWKIRTDDGRLFYIQSFEVMERVTNDEKKEAECPK